MAQTVILETVDLSKSFGGLAANQGINLQVLERTFHSVIGPNGAGKTTLFNLISGVHRPTTGKVLFKGEDITHLPPHLIARRGMGRSFQITNLFPGLSVLENVRLAAQACGSEGYKLWRHSDDLTAYRDKAEANLELVGLSDRRHLLASTLAHGEKRKLELAIMLAGDPQLLLLDEPTAGMSREEVPGILAVIERIRGQGNRTILMVEHKMDIVMGLSDAITVLQNGRVLAQGTPAQIAADERVQEAYLGGSHGFARAAVATTAAGEGGAGHGAA
ncbi:MAG: ABC transporter ATP-binding protein [Symbiobacteriia bacterium]